MGQKLLDAGDVVAEPVLGEGRHEDVEVGGGSWLQIVAPLANESVTDEAKDEKDEGNRPGSPCFKTVTR